MRFNPHKRKPVDASRREVPAHLHEVFLGRQRMLEWAARLWVMRGEFRQIAEGPSAKDLDCKSILQQLDDMRRQVLHAMPFVECGCGPREVCEICGGVKWVSAGKFLNRLCREPKLLSPECSENSPLSAKSVLQEAPQHAA